MKQSYKIEITKTYCVDVVAESQKEAEEKAENELDEAMLAGTEHYLQTGDTEFTAYNVTDTDDETIEMKAQREV